MKLKYALFATVLVLSNCSTIITASYLGGLRASASLAGHQKTNGECKIYIRIHSDLNLLCMQKNHCLHIFFMHQLLQCLIKAFLTCHVCIRQCLLPMFLSRREE